MIERIARAKINLALHVTGQREDGYHLLDTLVAFAEAGDRVCVTTHDLARDPVSVSIAGPFGAGLSSGSDNLITIAAVILRETVMQSGMDLAPVAIHVEKNLPIAGGIGGGSADAAATLLALQEHWRTNVDLAPLAKRLGSDVAMCLHSKPVRAQGIGDEISQLTMDEPLNLVLVNSGQPVSTPEVFGALTIKKNLPVSEIAIATMPPVAALYGFRNDLQPHAINLQPSIQAVLDGIGRTGPRLARMSGSGGTCFGIYETFAETQVAAKTIRSKHPDWWCVATSAAAS